jgi:hypothetical protein
MAWTDGADKDTGDVITSAIWNNYLGTAGSIQKTAPAVVTTAGDVIYATADNTIARLAIGSANEVLAVNSGASAPEWVAAGGGAWTLEAYDSGEDTTTSTSDAVIKTIGSLNIAATKPIMVLGQTRNSGGTATATFFLGVNGAAIGNSSNTGLCYGYTAFTSGTSSAGFSMVYFAPRSANYTARYNNALGWNWRDTTYTELTKITDTATLPTSAITSIDIRGKTSSGAVSAVVGPTFVYSMNIA